MKLILLDSSQHTILTEQPCQLSLQTREQQQQNQVTTACSLTHIQESSNWGELQKTRAGRKRNISFPQPHSHVIPQSSKSICPDFHKRGRRIRSHVSIYYSAKREEIKQTVKQWLFFFFLSPALKLLRHAFKEASRDTPGLQLTSPIEQIAQLHLYYLTQFSSPCLKTKSYRKPSTAQMHLERLWTVNNIERKLEERDLILPSAQKGLVSYLLSQ